MIPGSFDYHRPSSLAEVAGLLAEHGDEARVIAGGHSLIPVMKQRLTAISHLVDLQDVAQLKGISIDGGYATIGAMTTQNELITHAGLHSAIPLLREAALQIADPQVRYVGTVGGNVANGDPANDMPGLMQCLGAWFELSGPNGVRELAARDFYESAYVTAREEDEVLVSIRIPVPAAGTGYAYEKQKRKIGDYATAAAAVLIQKDGGTISSASIAMTNLADTPIYAEAAGAALVSTSGDDAAVSAAVEAAKAAISPAADQRGPVEFKIHVAGIMLARAIARAAERAA